MKPGQPSSLYRKKPVVITAVQWRSQEDDIEGVKDYDEDLFEECEQCYTPLGDHGQIKTLEGWHIVCPGDWIITGIRGEKYPCKPDIFQATYESVLPAKPVVGG